MRVDYEDFKTLQELNHWIDTHLNIRTQVISVETIVPDGRPMFRLWYWTT